MALSSGSSTLSFPVDYGGTRTGQRSSPIFDSWVLQLLKLFKPMAPEEHPSDSSRIAFGFKGTVHTELSRDVMWQRVINVAKAEGVPLVIAMAADKFSTVPEVVGVYALAQEEMTVVSVLLDMPEFNYDVWQRLMECRVNTTRVAQSHDVVLDFNFLPYSQLDPHSPVLQNLGKPVHFSQ